MPESEQQWIRRHSTPQDLAEIRRWERGWKRKGKRTVGACMRIALEEFRIKFLKEKEFEGRISLLRGMTECTWRQMSKKVRDRKREKFDDNKWKYFHLQKPCQACGAPAEVRHHIIPLLMGGSNHGANLMRLCRPCHARIHDHLPKVSPC